MGIVDQCVDRILKRITLEPAAGNFPGQLALPPGFEQEVDLGNFSPQLVEEEGEELLGYYEPMASPGRLVLKVNCLSSFFWYHARDFFRAGYYIEENDLRCMCHMVVMKTYTHEQFHHFCDVARHLFGTGYDRLREEALAVAWSYFQLEELRCQWSSKEARLSAGIYRDLLPRLFQFRSPGYRDWINYKSRADFELEMIHYTGPASSGTLERNKINMSNVLVRILEATKAQGVVEEIKY